MTTEPRHDPAPVLAAYQAACRSLDVKAAVEFFTADGQLEYGGDTYVGAAALRNAHLWDRGAQNHIALLELNIAGDTVHCIFANQHELHRVLGVQAIRSPAEITMRGGLIGTFRILAPQPESLQAFREKAAPFFAWVRVHQAEAWQRTAVLNETGGRTLFELARAWQAARARAGL